MSIDLFVTRESSPISWQEVAAVLERLPADLPGLSFYPFDDSDRGTTAYFWKVSRAFIAFDAPLDEDIEEEEVAALRCPYVVVNSGSRAWPWVDFMAVELARRLGGTIYDPQNGDFYAALESEYDIGALHALHEEQLRDREVTLITRCSAKLGTSSDDAALLRSIVEAVRQAAIEVLGMQGHLELGEKQVNWSHSFLLPSDAEITVSSVVALGVPRSRSISVRGPQGTELLAPFAAAIERRLAIKFRCVDEYE